MSRFKDMYQNEIVAGLTKKFEYKNPMQVPKLDKVVINIGLGEAKDNHKLLDAAIKDMELITGQKAIKTKAKNSAIPRPKSAPKTPISTLSLLTPV